EDIIVTPPPPRQRPPDLSNGKALAIYLNAALFDWEGPVGRYLIGRAIHPAYFDYRRLAALRYHARCWCEERGKQTPATVAPIIHLMTRKQIGTHRTYLASAEPDRWFKAPLAAPKKVLGRTQGGVIPLTRGASGKGLGSVPETDKILLG